MKTIILLAILAPLAAAHATSDVTWYGAIPGDSADDAAAINAAIAALPQSGGSVNFPSGQYIISSRITVARPAVRLVSSGGAIVMAAPGSAMTEMFYFTPLARGFSISGLVFDGNRKRTGTRGSTCIGVQASDFSIESVEVRECDFIGIGFWNESSSGTLNKVWVHDNGSNGHGQGYGIHGFAGQPSVIRPTGIVIQSSRIERNYNLAANPSGFSRYGAAICADIYNLVLRDSYIADNFNVGGQVVDCGPAPTRPRNWRLYDNRVELTSADLGTTGGFEHNSSGLIASGNSFKGLYYGLAVSSVNAAVSGVSVSNNRFESILHHAVWLIGASSPNTLRGVSVVGNHFKSVGDCIRFDTGSESHTRILMNDFTEAVGPIYSGSGQGTQAAYNIPN